MLVATDDFGFPQWIELIGLNFNHPWGLGQIRGMSIGARRFGVIAIAKGRRQDTSLVWSSWKVHLEVHDPKIAPRCDRRGRSWTCWTALLGSANPHLKRLRAASCSKKKEKWYGPWVTIINPVEWMGYQSSQIDPESQPWRKVVFQSTTHDRSMLGMVSYTNDLKFLGALEPWWKNMNHETARVWEEQSLALASWEHQFYNIYNIS